MTKRRPIYVYVLFIQPAGDVYLYRSKRALLKALYTDIGVREGGFTEYFRTHVYPKIKENLLKRGYARTDHHSYEIRLQGVASAADLNFCRDENEPVED